MRECLLRRLNFSAAPSARLVCGMLVARMCQMATCGNVKSGVAFSVRFSIEKVLAQMHHFETPVLPMKTPLAP